MGSSKIEELRINFEKCSFTTRQAIDVGVSSRMLTHFAKRGELERVGRGLYIFPDFDANDDFQFHQTALIAKSIKDSVICVISALSYWGLTDELEREHWLAIPNNHPTPKSINNAKFIRPRDLKTGVIKKIIAEQEVKITNPERSICEAFKYLSEESAISSLRAYMDQDQSKVDLMRLLDTASKLKANKLIKIVRDIAMATGKDYPRLRRDTFRAFIKWNKKESERKNER